MFEILIITFCGIGNVLDVSYWTCLLKKRYSCPDNDIKFYLYTPDDYSYHKPMRKRIDVRNSLALSYSGWDSQKKNVIIIHGFNGTESKTPMTIIRDAYLQRGDYNVFMVDWLPLARFPCYISSLSNTRLLGQCVAQLYAYIMDLGGLAEKTVCVGHSLGAHICGMVSNHLTIKQHKIVGLDPARPLVSQFGSTEFRLSPEDAHQVQIIHTNAGVLGDSHRSGHVNFCVNGGIHQPGCKGHKLRRARCSHFQSACYFAATVRDGSAMIGRLCSDHCPKKSSNWGYLPGKSIPMGHDTPFNARGTYCVTNTGEDDCPFN
ncbi:phospholipase A1 1 isoform X2 [Onthophagus taurus]|uniref:phospholipase A1 1 isoform X2 n=1 Tax=Onthophagus taurus TaxID=166361 RepID=UPI0039BE075C